MIQRIISCIFLLTASFTLLAHEIIPHHHHHESVCLEDELCNTDHGHSGNQDEQQADCCLLAERLFLINKNNVQEVILHASEDQKDLPFTQLFHANQPEIIPDSGFILKASFSPLSSCAFQNTALARLHGLRAPPAI